MKHLFTSLFLTAAFTLNAQEAKLLRDFNTEGYSTFRYDAEIESYTTKNQMYFIVDQEKTGGELWRTNGTEVGTQLVKDIAAGIGSSSPDFIGSVDDILLFNASIPDSGRYLHTSNGSSTGTKPLVDIGGNPVPSASEPVMVNDILYFLSGNKLYQTQGTAVSTQTVLDFSGFNFSIVRGLTFIGDLFFFKAYTSNSGYEPWVSDGTINGTQLLKDINPGNASSDVIGGNSGISGENKVFFLAENGSHGKELWVSNGTTAGTLMTKDLTPGTGNSIITFLGVVNDVLYFVFRESIINRFVWKTDGTEEGTVKLPGNIRAGNSIMFKGDLYFTGNNKLWKVDGNSEVQITEDFVEYSLTTTKDWLYYLGSSNEGISLWRTDGTEDGEEFIKYVTDKSYYDVENLFSAGENIFFTCETDSFGIELWASDGTAEGTQMMVDSRPGPEDGFESWIDIKFGYIGEKLIYTGLSEKHGRELWISDATPEGTRMIRDLTPRTSDINLRELPVEYKGLSYFLAGTGFWRTDGTPEGTELVGDFLSTNTGGLQILNNKLVFTADYPMLGRTLIMSDGTTEGTKPVFDTSNNKTTRMLMRQEDAVFKGSIYFRGLNEFGYELWKTDGSVEGTYMVKDIWEGDQQSDIEVGKDNTVVFNGELYFGASSELLGYELWKTDGTEAGTVPVTDINPQGNSSVSNPTLLNNIIIFNAIDGSSGRELWRTDGTIDGTRMIKDIYPGEKSGIPYSRFIRYKDHIYFEGENEEFGRELWRTEGTEEGTELFLDLNTGSAWSRPSDFQVIGDHLYFLASSNEGRRIFRTDGTAEGTIEVTDADVNFSYFHADGTIFYDTYSASSGNQMWRISPENSEPFLVQGVPNGYQPGHVRFVNYINNTLFFKAFEEIHGQELWTLSPLEASVSIESTGEAICSPEDTLSLQANLFNSGKEPVITWYLNGDLLPGKTSNSIKLTGLSDGDEIRVSVVAASDLWLTNYNPESEKYLVNYDNPAAEITISQNTLMASEGTSYIWYLNGSPLGISTQSITVTESGTYTVEVFNENGCSALSNPVAVVINPTGIEVSSGIGELKVYPNPATDKIILRPTRDLAATLSITNIDGKKVYYRDIEILKEGEFEIPVGNLDKGIYIIQVTSGSETLQKRILIQ